jgi:hypothetical protein
VDVDDQGDQYVRHVVPMPEDIELARDDRHNPVVYSPDGAEPVPSSRDGRVARTAVTHCGATKDVWIGERPDADWDWLENTEDLTASDRYDHAHPDGDGEDDDDLESTPARLPRSSHDIRLPRNVTVREIQAGDAGAQARTPGAR